MKPEKENTVRRFSIIENNKGGRGSYGSDAGKVCPDWARREPIIERGKTQGAREQKEMEGSRSFRGQKEKTRT